MLIILFVSIFEQQDPENRFFPHLRFTPLNVEQIDFAISNMIHQQSPHSLLLMFSNNL